MAEALGMQVMFYDTLQQMPHGLAKSVSTMEEVLSESDFVTFHVPDTADTKNMITERELSLMKRGSYLINASRGKVVDLEALEQSLLTGHLGGAALDVFPWEPASNGQIITENQIKCYGRLNAYKNVIFTPHIGGSTIEAQRTIGNEVSRALCRYFTTGSTVGAVSFPEVFLKGVDVGNGKAVGESCCRLMNVHLNVPGVLRTINAILGEFNIIAQSTDSRENVAYLMADLEDITVEESLDLLERISLISHSLASRMIHGSAGHLLEKEWN